MKLFEGFTWREKIVGFLATEDGLLVGILTDLSITVIDNFPRDVGFDSRETVEWSRPFEIEVRMEGKSLGSWASTAWPSESYRLVASNGPSMYDLMVRWVGPGSAWVAVEHDDRLVAWHSEPSGPPAKVPAC